MKLDHNAPKYQLDFWTFKIPIFFFFWGNPLKKLSIMLEVLFYEIYFNKLVKFIKQPFFGNLFISNDLSPHLGLVFKNERRDFSKVGCSKIKDLWDSTRIIYNLKGLRSLHIIRNPSNVEAYKKLHWLFDLGCCGKLALGPTRVALISNCLFNQLCTFLGALF